MYRFESERQQHIEQYGSFLYCPQRDALCSFMEEKWKTGCSCGRDECILDDPEYIALKKTQKRNQARIADIQRKRHEEERSAAPIRTQNKSWRDTCLKRIQRLEEESRQAYRRNRPKLGEWKLHEAMMLRRELRRKDGKDV